MYVTQSIEIKFSQSSNFKQCCCGFVIHLVPWTSKILLPQFENLYATLNALVFTAIKAKKSYVNWERGLESKQLVCRYAKKKSFKVKTDFVGRRVQKLASMCGDACFTGQFRFRRGPQAC